MDDLVFLFMCQTSKIGQSFHASFYRLSCFFLKPRSNALSWGT
jgi:hypothetical protein